MRQGAPVLVDHQAYTPRCRTRSDTTKTATSETTPLLTSTAGQPLPRETATMSLSSKELTDHTMAAAAAVVTVDTTVGTGPLIPAANNTAQGHS